MNVGKRKIPFVSLAKICEEQKFNTWCHSMLAKCAYKRENGAAINTWGGVTNLRLFIIFSMVLLPRS